MNPYTTYRRQDVASGWTRIDMLMALYDKALERLDKAEAALKSGDESAAVPLMAKTQLILSELAAGVNLDVNREVGENMLRLYEYAAHELRAPKAAGVRNARKVLETLREGFEAIRVEGAALERSGRLHSANKIQMVHATA